MVCGSLHACNGATYSAFSFHFFNPELVLIAGKVSLKVVSKWIPTLHIVAVHACNLVYKFADMNFMVMCHDHPIIDIGQRRIAEIDLLCILSHFSYLP